MAQASILLILSLEAAAMWVFIFWFWRDYRVDAFRDELFALRDELFMYAADGGVEFSHPAYAGLREIMNSCIRYAHELNLARFFLAIPFLKHAQRSPTLVEWERAVESLDSAEARQKLTGIHRGLGLVILKHMVLRSFLLSAILVPLRVWKITSVVRSKMYTAVPQILTPMEQLESAAIESDARRLKRRPAAAGA